MLRNVRRVIVLRAFHVERVVGSRSFQADRSIDWLTRNGVQKGVQNFPEIHANIGCDATPLSGLKLPHLCFLRLYATFA